MGILLQEHLCNYCYSPHRYFLFYYIPFTAYNFASISAEISEEENYQVRWLPDTLSYTSPPSFWRTKTQSFERRESSFNAFATPLMLSASLRNASETTLYALARSHNSAQLSVTPLLVNYHPWEASSVQGRLHATPLICWFAGFTAPPSHRAHYPAGYIN